MAGDVVDVNSVLQAIDALYLNPDASVKQQASKWLCEFQKSLHAWEISDQLLYMRRDLNSCYFGAQTIRNKIQCHFTELPVHSHEALKNSLLEHVRKLSGDTSVPIANQLCLALADLFCHMVQWNDGIKEIVESLSTNDVSCGYLIDVLRFIPEEMLSNTLRLGLNRRHALMSQFESNKARVINLLAEKSKTDQMAMFARIFNCLASWWNNTGVMTEQDIPVSPLLQTAFLILKNPSSTPETTYEAVTSWILALLYQCRNYSESKDGLLTWLQNNIYELVKVMQDCAAAASTNSTTNSTPNQSRQTVQVDMLRERCSCLAHLFSSLTRTVRSSLVDRPTSPGSGGSGDLRTLDCLLVILELSPPLGNRELASSTFYALQSLADDAIRHRSVITTASSNHSSFGTASNMSPGPRPVAALVPYFTRVVVALMRFCPSNVADLDSADELRDFRQDVHDLMQDILGLVGSETIFVELYNHIQRLQMLSASTELTAADLLKASEACLFMLTTVAKRLPPLDPEGHISSLVSGLVLPGLASSCPYPLQEVGCLLYMELSHWAACHPQLGRQIVAQLIGIVQKAAGLASGSLEPGQKQAVEAALSALGALCSIYRSSLPGSPNGLTSATADSTLRVGHSLLDEHWSALVEHVTYNLPRLAWVPIHDATHFFTGIARGLASSVGSGSGSGGSGGGSSSTGGSRHEFDPRPARRALPSRLAQICSVSLECLTKLMDNNVPVTGTDTLTDPCVWLDYLAAVFRSLGSLLRRLDDGVMALWPGGAGGAGQGAELTSLTQSAQTCLAECLNLVRQTIWPVVSRVFVHYASRSRPMEHACRLVRFVVRCFSIHLRDLLPEIAEKIVIAYTTGGQHSSFLYLSSVLVDEFGELADCRSGLVRVFEAVGGPTLKMLDGPGLSQQPHTVEDLYRLCTRLVQHCPAAFLTSTSIDLSLLCNMAVQSLNLYSAASSVDHGVDDITGSADQTANDDSISQSAAGASAATAAHFLFDLLVFTGESSESTPAEVARILSSGGQLPANPSCQSSQAALRVLIWLVQPTSYAEGTDHHTVESGGQRLVSACLQTCCLSPASEEQVPELADILYQLKAMTTSELFTVWLDTAVSSLPIHRTDGLIHATPEQVADFKNLVMKSSKSSALIRSLHSFSSLFR